MTKDGRLFCLEPGFVSGVQLSKLERPAGGHHGCFEAQTVGPVSVVAQEMADTARDQL